jgi:dihydropteroate synthase
MTPRQKHELSIELIDAIESYVTKIAERNYSLSFIDPTLTELVKMYKHDINIYERVLKRLELRYKRINEPTNESIIDLYAEMTPSTRAEVRAELEAYCDDCDNDGYYWLIGQCSRPTSECCGGCETRVKCECK